MSYFAKLIELQSRYMAESSAIPGQIVLSPGISSRLRNSSFADGGFTLQRYDQPITLFGADLIESQVQLTRRKLVSLDRWCDYDERDADWAVPLGLAKWVDIDVDALVMKRVNSMIGGFMRIDSDAWDMSALSALSSMGVSSE